MAPLSLPGHLTLGAPLYDLTANFAAMVFLALNVALAALAAIVLVASMVLAASAALLLWGDLILLWKLKLAEVGRPQG